MKKGWITVRLHLSKNSRSSDQIIAEFLVPPIITQANGIQLLSAPDVVVWQMSTYARDDIHTTETEFDYYEVISVELDDKYRRI